MVIPLAERGAPISTSRPSTRLMEQLGKVCQDRGADDLAARLIELRTWIADDLRSLESELEVIPRGPRAVQKAAGHLLDLGGKHLRPMCVALAARCGDGFNEAARHIAVAIEMIHTATLLHDDVVDVGDKRRGAPAARLIYGNAASIFAGDWLLIRALRRVRRARVDGVLDSVLEVIDEMILAESIQLEGRGRIASGTDEYFHVVEGKTASLFRLAMGAGARAGGLAPHQCAALEGFGNDLGVAFQLVDDALDFADDGATGKSLFADLREGKMTYPLLVAIEREPGLRPLVEQAAVEVSADLAGEITSALERTGALADCRQLARDRIDAAIERLDAITEGPARQALITVAQATAFREK